MCVVSFRFLSCRVRSCRVSLRCEPAGPWMNHRSRSRSSQVFVLNSSLLLGTRIHAHSPFPHSFSCSSFSISCSSFSCALVALTLPLPVSTARCTRLFTRILCVRVRVCAATAARVQRDGARQAGQQRRAPEHDERPRALPLLCNSNSSSSLFHLALICMYSSVLLTDSAAG